MDAEALKFEAAEKNWKLIQLVAKHDYIPNGANGQALELARLYHGKVDMWCGHCIVQMCKWYYENYKTKIPDTV